MAGAVVTGRSSWIITPETTVDDPVNLDDTGNDKYIRMIRDFVEEYPGVAFVTGLVSYRQYPPSLRAPTRSAVRIHSSGIYEDRFNSAFKIDTGKTTEVYHKSKLVSGIEMQFNYSPGRIIARLLPDLGGTTRGFGIQKERTCFSHPALKYKIAPVICYESAYGSFVTGYVRNGAGALFIMTNDGWWKNTTGYKQHLDYASLRAIETRRPVVRAANTGVSCIIDIKGRRIAETGWWRQEVLKGEIKPGTGMTFYVKYGDYLMHFSLVTSTFIILLILPAGARKEVKKRIIAQKKQNS